EECILTEKKNGQDERIEDRKKKGMRLPDAYIILFVFLVLAAVATYIIPAGEFETEESSEGIDVIIPDTYSIIDSNPAGFLDLLSVFVAGLIRTSVLILLLLVVGGVFAVMEKTGAIAALVNKILRITMNMEWMWIMLVINV